jgi:glycosyltransferase involved in cell wall biosynthesis
MKPLRVCVFTQQLRSVFSGPGLHANLLVASLVEEGHHVWVVAPMDQRPAETQGYTFVGVPNPLLRGSQARWVSLAWNYRTAVQELLRREAMDLFHFTDAHEALFCRDLRPKIGNVNDTYSAELRSLAYYRRHYNDWLVRWGYYNAVHLAEGWIYPNFERLVTNSQFTTRVIAGAYRLRSECLSLCYKAVDVERYRPVREQRGVAPPGRNILFVGTNMQRKGLPALIRAAPAILARFPDARFQVVGKDTCVPVMAALCRDCGVEAAFEFLGWRSQEDLLACYARAAVFTLPALTEALGVAFLEAMAAGVAVVGSRTGGIPEIIQDGENGLLVAPDDPAGLARAIVAILENPAEAARLAHNGLETALRFDRRHMLDCTYAIYADILRD